MDMRVGGSLMVHGVWSLDLERSLFFPCSLSVDNFLRANNLPLLRFGFEAQMLSLEPAAHFMGRLRF
jgi:hypothetical protein